MSHISGSTTKKRRRISSPRKSCDPCHKSKLKCDRKRPYCSTCQAFNKTCSYATPDRYDVEISEQGDLPSAGGTTALFATVPSHRGVHSSLPADQACGEHSVNPQTSNHTRGINQQTMPEVFHFPDPATRVTEAYGLQTPPTIEAPGTSLAAQECGMCLKPDCVECQLRELDLAKETTQMVTPATESLLPSLAENDFMACTLLRAMASGSDRESSMLLAALRTGTSLPTIYKAICSADYELNGLAHTLEMQNTTKPESPQSSFKPSHPALTAEIAIALSTWDLPGSNIEGATSDLATDLVGSLKQSKKKRPKSQVQSGRPNLTRATSSAPEIRLPVWAILPVHSKARVMDPFDKAFSIIQADLESGQDIDEYCGSHAYIGALLQTKEEGSIPRLSQVVAGLVRAFMGHEASPSTTSLALMWLHWTIWSWMLSPTERNYQRMPELIRPTPWQLLSPHPLVYDFVIVPALRDHLCESPRNASWILPSCESIQCDWPKTTLHALCRRPITKAIDLHDDCKAHAARIQSWSFGANVRLQMPHVDQYIRIRA